MKVRDELREMRMIIKDVILGIKELQESQKKTDEQLKKTDKQLKETDKQLKKMIGELTDGWGKFVEGLVEPSVRKVFKEVGIEVRETFQRPTASINGRNLEIDILGIGKDRKGRKVVLIVEVKSNLNQQEIDRTVKAFEKFTEFFPEYKGKKIIGVVAGIRVAKGSDEYATRKGLYILIPSGEVMQIKNPKDFKPRYWN